MKMINYRMSQLTFNHSSQSQLQTTELMCILTAIECCLHELLIFYATVRTASASYLFIQLLIESKYIQTNIKCIVCIIYHEICSGPYATSTMKIDKCNELISVYLFCHQINQCMMIEWSNFAQYSNFFAACRFVDQRNPQLPTTHYRQREESWLLSNYIPRTKWWSMM